MVVLILNTRFLNSFHLTWTREVKSVAFCQAWVKDGPLSHIQKYRTPFGLPQSDVSGAYAQRTTATKRCGPNHFSVVQAGHTHQE